MARAAGLSAASVQRLWAANDIKRHLSRTFKCTRNIEMTPLSKVEVTLPRVLGSRGMRRGGGVDEQAGVQPA